MRVATPERPGSGCVCDRVTGMRESKRVGEGRRVLWWKERVKCKRKVLVGQQGITFRGHF